jgi:hypothetical protein
MEGDNYSFLNLVFIQTLPGIVDVMLSRLAEFLERSVPPNNVPEQWEVSNPSLRGGVWLPWLDMEGNPINLV